MKNEAIRRVLASDCSQTSREGREEMVLLRCDAHQGKVGAAYGDRERKSQGWGVSGDDATANLENKVDRNREGNPDTGKRHGKGSCIQETLSSVCPMCMEEEAGGRRGWKERL